MRREPSLLPRLTAGLLTAGALYLMVGLGGCGARGPLDAEATNVTLAGADATADAPSTVDAPPDTGTSVVDAGREASAIACGSCVLTTCGQTILTCLQAEACRTVLQCVGTTCLGGGGGAGGINPVCLFQCANGDPAGALGVLSVFQCITGSCGTDCSSVLGGLGGLPGGGGGGGNGNGGGGNGGGGKGAAGMPSEAVFHELFSEWPALFSPAAPHDAPATPHESRSSSN